MNKLILRLGMLVLVCLGASIQASPNMIIAPSPLYRAYAYSHYPFARVDFEDCKDDCKWLWVDIWGAAEYRTANSAFRNSNTTKTEPISGIFFGADSFTIGEAFPGVVIPGLPLLNISTFRPTFDYTERNAYFGANLETMWGCDCQWRGGLRLRVPFTSIKTELDSCCDLETDTIEDLFIINDERRTCTECSPAANIPQTVTDSYAARLDLLSALFVQQSGIPPFEPLVIYGNDGTIPVTRIAGEVVTDLNDNPIYVIYSPLGKPTPPFAYTPGQIANLPFLNGAGTNVTNARFDDDVDYTALSNNPAAQRNFWVAPQINTDGGGNLEVVDSAQTIFDEITHLLQLDSINRQSVSSFLLSSTALGIDFNTKRRNGIGDFDTELYARYDGCLCECGSWFAEGIFGARFPTAKRNNHPNQLLLVPTGANGHYQVKLGGLLGVQPIEWFAVKVDAFYYWVLRRKQAVAAPFAGATIFGIGPTVQADVSWQYFVGDIDFTFLIPCACDFIGFNVGYQPWVKRKDHVSFDVTAVTNPVGDLQAIDPTILQRRTKRIAHTVKTEIFMQACDWQIFAGWNHSFAGQNSLKNSDWYLGLQVYF